MGSYTKIVKRYRGGDAIWTNKSNALNIIVNDFFGAQPSGNINVNVTPLLSTLAVNSVSIAVSQIKAVSTLILTSQLNPVVASVSVFKVVSVITALVQLSSVLTSVSVSRAVSSLNCNTEINNVNVLINANVDEVSLNVNLELLNVTAFAESNVNVNVLPLLLNALLNTATATVLDTSQNEILRLKSYFTNELIINSKLTNKKQWESYTKVKLTLLSRFQ